MWGAVNYVRSGTLLTLTGSVTTESGLHSLSGVCTIVPTTVTPIQTFAIECGIALR